MKNKLFVIFCISISFSQANLQMQRIVNQRMQSPASINNLFDNKATNLNTTFKDHKSVGGEYNDIWGFKESSQQYIIISKVRGFAVYKINSNGTADLIVDENSINNDNSIWGEVRFYNGYIYKSTENGSIRIYSINLTDSTSTYVNSFHGKAHNIALYQNYLLACGGSELNNGVVCYDITNPLNPVQKWVYNKFYVHDMTVQNDTLYIAEGSELSFALYDISNVTGSSLGEEYLILRHSYPGSYTHNIWPSPDGKYVVTTDEANISNHLQFWDISDPNNVLNLLKHREGDASIVHNAFIKNDFIYISYYTKGFVVFDISDKRLPIKIGAYDTYLPLDGGTYNGAWGVYPFMDSNYVALSTIETGLDIIEFDQSIRAGSLIVTVFDTLLLPYSGEVNVTVSDNKYVKYYQDQNQIHLKGTPGTNYQLTFTIPSENFSKSITHQFPNNVNESISYTIHPTDSIPPSAPNLISVTGGDKSISIKWQKNNEPDVYRYLLYVDTLANAATLYDSVGFATSSRIIVNLVKGKTYYVRLRARDTSDNLSNFSNELSAEAIDTTEPLAPNLDELIAGDGFVKFKWQLNPEADVSGYRLYLDTMEDASTLIGIVDETMNEFSHSVTNGITYYGRIQAVDSNNNVSEYSNEFSATPQLNIGKDLVAEISLFQNPVLSSQVNMLIETNLNLSSQPLIFLNTQELITLTIDSAHYSSSITLTGNSLFNLAIHIQAFGAITDTNRLFTIQTVNKLNPLFISENNHLELKLSNSDLDGSYLISENLNDETSIYDFLTPLHFILPARLKINYDNEIINPEKLFIYQSIAGQWQRLSSQVFKSDRSVVAYIDQLTRFKLEIDPNFSGSNLVPERHQLFQNYPNPFNPTSTIQYDLATDDNVRITIYNMIGQKVRTLVNEFQFAGPTKKVVWDGTNDAGQKVASGIYLYQIRTYNFIQSRKMVLIK